MATNVLLFFKKKYIYFIFKHNSLLEVFAQSLPPISKIFTWSATLGGTGAIDIGIFCGIKAFSGMCLTLEQNGGPAGPLLPTITATTLNSTE